uniref:Lysine-specific metallo-endopeptidase domain-containing protein n=1 Tax=Erythrolobus madagascarensis TaxID=708628 RepID=A0A7S0XIC4_9RHOD|mmetsp:Transcript_3399/g.7337  ORF Transcript_3399/g.7337 Transcript_3399/m.7337 type:complete len:644 (+) Transcript_3399:33-1964(+)
MSFWRWSECALCVALGAIAAVIGGSASPVNDENRNTEPQRALIEVTHALCLDGSGDQWCVRVALHMPHEFNENNTTYHVETRGTPWDVVTPSAAFVVLDKSSGDTLEYIGAIARRRSQSAPGFTSWNVERSADVSTVRNSRSGTVRLMEKVVDLSDGFLFENGRSYGISLLSNDVTIRMREGDDETVVTVTAEVFYEGGGVELVVNAASDSKAPWIKEKAASANQHRTRKQGTGAKIAVSASTRAGGVVASVLDGVVAERQIGDYEIVNCIASMQTKMESSVNLIQAAASSAVTDYLNRINSDDAECSASSYVDWFGVQNSERQNEVTISLATAANRFNEGGYVIQCGGDSCDDNIFAYVFPQDPDLTIHMCTIGQDAPGAVEVNSQPGTLLHEMLHFVPIAGTRDLAYGTLDCLDLAADSPDWAVVNSDSYEYFVETGPACDKDDGSFSNELACFPASAFVELESGERRRMDEVKIGDVVVVGFDEKNGGEKVFSAVYAFGHRDERIVANDYVRIAVSCGETLLVSEGHLVYANGQLRAARDVVVGDSMRCVSFGGTLLAQHGIVERVEPGVTRRGRFNPHTKHGDIVVDGVVSSTYTDIFSPTLAHCLLLIDRVFHSLMQRSLLSSFLKTGCPSSLLAFLS